MSRNNDNELMASLTIGAVVLGAIAFAIIFAGVFIALLGVAGFVFSQWHGIYRYEGSKPIWAMAGITAVVALPCASVAFEQFQMMGYYLDRSDDRWLGALFTAIISIVIIAAPTAIYWVYRLIQPISHFRIGIIEHFHEQYQGGNLTRIERDARIKVTIEMGDEALEQELANARREPEPPTVVIDPTPEAQQSTTSMAPANNNHPRDAFDIPPQRVDG